MAHARKHSPNPKPNLHQRRTAVGVGGKEGTATGNTPDTSQTLELSLPQSPSVLELGLRRWRGMPQNTGRLQEPVLLQKPGPAPRLRPSYIHSKRRFPSPIKNGLDKCTAVKLLQPVQKRQQPHAAVTAPPPVIGMAILWPHVVTLSLMVPNFRGGFQNAGGI